MYRTNFSFAAALKLHFDISVRASCLSPSIMHDIYFSCELRHLRHFAIKMYLLLRINSMLAHIYVNITPQLSKTSSSPCVGTTGGGGGGEGGVGRRVLPERVLWSTANNCGLVLEQPFNPIFLSPNHSSRLPNKIRQLSIFKLELWH